jgi:hypothetical protein
VATQEHDVESGDELMLVIDAARSAIAQEYDIAERLDAKARNQVTIAGAWYAAALTGIGFALKAGPHISRWWYVPILSFAAAAGFCLAVTLIKSYQVWKLRSAWDIAPEGIEDMAAAAQSKDAKGFRKDLVTHYREILRTRRSANERRRQAFTASFPWWIASLALTLAALLSSFLVSARLFT